MFVQAFGMDSGHPMPNARSNGCQAGKVDVEGMEMQVIEELGTFHFEVVQLEFTPGATCSKENFVHEATQKLGMINPTLYDLESNKGNNARNIIFKK
jgi:hypothetical protein